MKPVHAVGTLTALLALTLTLTACDSGEDDGLTISGSVTIPEGADIVNTQVTACFVDRTYDVETCNFGSPNTQFVHIEETGTSASFRFTDLAEGKYRIDATKDFGGDDFWEYGDRDCNPGGDGNCSYFVPPAENVNLAMQSIENDFRIQINAPDGVDIPGTEVGFCVVDGDQCDPDLSLSNFATHPWEPGEIYRQQFSPFSQPQYVLLAGKDVNGDGTWEVWNCYTLDGQICEEVSPGALQVYTIHMLETDASPPAPYPLFGGQPALTPEVRAEASALPRGLGMPRVQR